MKFITKKRKKAFLPLFPQYQTGLRIFIGNHDHDNIGDAF